MKETRIPMKPEKGKRQDILFATQGQPLCRKCFVGNNLFSGTAELGDTQRTLLSRQAWRHGQPRSSSVHKHGKTEKGCLCFGKSSEHQRHYARRNVKLANGKLKNDDLSKSLGGHAIG